MRVPDSDGINNAVAAQDTPTLDLTKPLQTKEGGQAFLTEPEEDDGSFTAVVKILSNNEWAEIAYLASGIAAEYHENLNIINTPVKHKLTGFLNVNRKNDVDWLDVFDHNVDADLAADSSRIATIDLSDHNITYEEGEGI